MNADDVEMSSLSTSNHYSAAGAHMDFAIRNQQGAVNVEMQGQFTFDDNQQFKDILELAKQLDTRSIDLNISNVTFMDSAAMGMLLLLRDQADERRIKVRLHSPQGHIMKIFEISRLDHLFSILP